MSSLLSASEITFFTGEFSRHFETFAVSNLIIYKKPIVTYTNPNSNNTFPGYENPSDPNNITYTIVSGQFPCLARYGRDQKTDTFQEIKVTIPQGQCQIKVKEEARNYIDNGVKTENVILDGITWNEITTEGVQNYLGLKYYYYMLKRSN